MRGRPAKMYECAYCTGSFHGTEFYRHVSRCAEANGFVPYRERAGSIDNLDMVRQDLQKRAARLLQKIDETRAP